MSTRKPSEEKAHTITHLTTVHPPFDVRIFHKECKSIARAGYDVTLIACHDRDETVDGVRLKGIPKRSGRLSRITRGVWTVFREARRTDSELYHFHDPELIPVGLLMRLKGKKVVYDVHEDVRADMAAKYYIPQPLRRLLTWLVSVIEAGAVRHFSAVVPATIPIGHHFESRTYHTVVVSNYPLVDELHPVIRTPWAQRSPSIAYIGILAKDRCASEMVQAMGFLPESLKATLKLAGIFSPQDLRDELAENNGWDRTQFLGILGRVQVRELLAEVRAGLTILKPTPGFLESAPIKLFEYMSAGIPVIASNFPGFRKIVEEAGCGIVVDPLDPRSIARAIEYIFHHPEEAEQMGLRGREAVKNFYNWPSEERKLLNLYRKLLDPPCVA
jgi:glycosyltransferase involved in cell wall biosynthesis